MRDWTLPSRAFRVSVVVLRCGARRHRHPPRVGEVFEVYGGAIALRVQRTQGPLDDGRGLWNIADGHGLNGPRSVRFPCRRDCPADWNVEAARLRAAYERAVATGRRTLTLGVDL